MTFTSGTLTGTGTLSLSGTGTVLTLGGGLTISAPLAFTSTGGLNYTAGSASTIASSIDLGSTTHSFNIQDGVGAVDLTASSAITGVGGSLIKTGAGVMLFSGTTSNTYTGSTTVSAGTLQLNKTSATAIRGDVTINVSEGSGTNAIQNLFEIIASGNSTFAGSLNGGKNAGGDNPTNNNRIVKSGTGNLTLSGSGNLISRVFVANGQLILQNGLALGTSLGQGANTGASIYVRSFTGGNGSLVLDTGITLLKDLLLNGPGYNSQGALYSTTGTNTVTGTITIGWNSSNDENQSDAAIKVDPTSTLYFTNASLNGSKNLSKIGFGTLIYSGTTFSNAMSGTTTVNEGSLYIQANNALSGSYVVQNGATFNNFATYSSSTNGSLTNSGSVINQGSITFRNLSMLAGTISNLGTGILENFGSLYPCNVIVYDGVLKNEGTIFPGKNVFIYGGTVENKAGGVLKPNTGVFLMTGGSLYNDQISELGSSTQNFTFTGGYILSPGEINANVYTQTNPAILQLDIASKLEYGKILANNANVGGKLIVNALTAFNGQVGDVIPIIQSPSGRIGTFSYVDYLAFANDLIPILLYTSKGVDLTFAATLTPSIAGSFGQIGLISVNQGLHRLLQKSSNLHDEIYAIGKKRSRLEKEKSFSGHFSSDSKSIVASSDPAMKFMSASNGALIREKQQQLAEKASEEKRSGLSVYIGPVASTGYLNDQWSNKEELRGQLGIDYTSMGVFGGADYYHETLGGGFAFNYESISGDAHLKAGKLMLNQVHAAGYAVITNENMKELSLNIELGGGFNSAHMSRVAGTKQAPVLALSEVKGTELDFIIGTEYIFSKSRFALLPKNFQIVPTLNFQYIHAWVPSFKEFDAGIFNLKVDSQVIRSARTLLGFRTSYLVEFAKEIKLRTELDVEWQREYINPYQKLNFETIGLTTIKTASSPVFGVGYNTWNVGVDLLFKMRRLQVEGYYNLQCNQVQLNQTFYLGVGLAY